MTRHMSTVGRWTKSKNITIFTEVLIETLLITVVLKLNDTFCTFLHFLQGKTLCYVNSIEVKKNNVLLRALGV
jgi:hypothetical protein